MFDFFRQRRPMLTAFRVYRYGELIHVFHMNYGLSPQKLAKDMTDRDGFEGPLLVVKNPAIKAPPPRRR